MTDLEGFEGDVIKGASQILQHFRSKIIFESNDTASRPICFDYGYSVYPLAWRLSFASHLAVDEFLKSKATNFIAIAGSAQH